MSGSTNLIVGEFIAVAIVSAYLLWYYKSPLVTNDVSVSVYLAWVLGFSGILFLPYDLSFAVIDNTDNQMPIVWTFVYWSTFILAWLILPIQMEFHNSGHFSFYGKLCDAISKNLISGAIAVIAAIVYVVAMVASGQGSVNHVIGFMMAAGNTYGILLIILLMGYGLVALPRRIWQISDYSSEQTRLYLTAPSVETSYMESRYELEDCEAEIGKIFDAVAGKKQLACSKECFNYISIIRNKMIEFEFSARSQSLQHSGSDSEETTRDVTSMLTKNNLISLHARLMKCQLHCRAAERRWKSLVRSVQEITDLLEGNVPTTEETWCRMRVLSSSSAAAESGCLRYAGDITVAVHHFWIKYCFRIVCRVLSVCCASSSLIILWSELVMASSLESPLGGIMNAYRGKPDEGIIVQSVAFVALFYMSFSLGFNFLMTLNLPQAAKTAFDALMKNITIVPLFGTSFTVYTPIIMIVVALITLLNLYSRILRAIGFEHEDAITSAVSCCGNRQLSQEDKDAVAAGKKMVDAELRHSGLKAGAKSDSRHGKADGTTFSLINGSGEPSSTSSSLDGSVCSVPTFDSFEIEMNRNSDKEVPKSLSILRGGKNNSYSARVFNPLTSSGISVNKPYSQLPTNSGSPPRKVVVKEADIDAVLDSDIEVFDFSIDGVETISAEDQEDEFNTFDTTKPHQKKVYNADIDTSNDDLYAGRYSNV